MKQKLLSFAASGVFLLFSLSASLGIDINIPPSPDRWVSDEAGFLSPQTIADLDAQLEAFEQSTGHQVIVYIGQTTGGVPIEDWAVKVFEAWKVGRKGMDDGLVLFIMTEDRKIRIEVGYGLEGVVPDAISSRVINEILIPNIQSGDNNRAVQEAVSSLIETISGRKAAESPKEGEHQYGKPSFSGGEFILIGIAVLFFLVLFITHPSLAIWLLFSILSGGRGGGGGRSGGGLFGGGGFRGGGGRSGGGGASGSW